MVHKDVIFMAISIAIWLCVFFVYYMVISDASSSSESVFNSFAENDGGYISSSLSVRSGNDNTEGTKNEVIPETVDSFESSADMKFSVLSDTLGGKFKSDIGYDFEFGPKGYFCGFFCSDRPNISDGSWSVIDEGGTPVLKIIDNKENQIVSYNIRMNGDKGYVLYYPSGDFSISLQSKK